MLILQFKFPLLFDNRFQYDLITAILSNLLYLLLIEQWHSVFAFLLKKKKKMQCIPKLHYKMRWGKKEHLLCLSAPSVGSRLETHSKKNAKIKDQLEIRLKDDDWNRLIFYPFRSRLQKCAIWSRYVWGVCITCLNF